MKNINGYSLMELLVVIGIVSTLLAIAAVSGHDWMVRSQVENQTRQMFTDLMSARMNAMQKNKAYFVTLAANQYSIYEDTFDTPDGNGSLDAGPGQDTRLLQKTTAYALSSTSTGTVSFSSCGLASGLVSDASYTIHVISTAESSFDCIVLNPTRILMGKWNGTDCSLQ